MKNLLFLCLFAPLSLFSQSDFDYTLFTTKAVYIKSSAEKSDTMQLLIQKKFEKHSNVLKQISVINTGNAVEYKLEFAGASYQTGCPVLMYKVIEVDGEPRENMYVFINPMEPSILFKSDYLFASFH